MWEDRIKKKEASEDKIMITLLSIIVFIAFLYMFLQVGIVIAAIIFGVFLIKLLKELVSWLKSR